MVGCTLSILSMNDFNLFSSCSHKKLSCQCTATINTVYSDSLIIFPSSYAINKMLHEGANLIPIAGHRFCLSVFYPNVNNLFFNTTSAKSIMVSAETYFSSWISSRFLNADKSWI